MMKKRYTYNEIVDRFGKDVADKAVSYADYVIMW